VSLTTRGRATGRYLMARPARSSRRLAWVRALGEAAVFLFVMGVIVFGTWLVTP
jgi:hypothetical protein